MKKNIKKDEKRVFAQGFSFYKLFLIFIVGSVIGTYYEQIYILIRSFIRDGSFVWDLRRGVIYGPFNVVYGMGAALMSYILARKERPWQLTVLYGAILGGVLEFGISYFQEAIVGTISWDYSSYFLNIQGRTTIPIMFFWGLLGLVFTKTIYPTLSRWIESIPYRIGVICTNILVVFMALNILVSWGAVIRQTLRRNNIKPITPVGHFFDTYYPDDFLKRYFSNMEIPTTKNK